MLKRKEALQEVRCAETASSRIAELVQLALDADVAILDLHGYSERQRATGAIEALSTSGAFRVLELGGPAAELSRLADPLEASARGFRSYAAVPIREDGIVLGRVAVLAREAREFDASAVKLMRTAADLAADLLIQARLAI